MKKTKLFSAFTAVALGITMMAGITTVNAYQEKYEVGETPGRVYVQTDKIFTLRELFDMSDEEFLSLDGYNLGISYAETYYNAVDYSVRGLRDIENRGIRGEFYFHESDVSYGGIPYKAGVVESRIEELFGDTVEYRIYSPAYMSREELNEKYMNYTDQISIVFPTYRSKSREEVEAITDETIMEYAKINYCLHQIGPFHMMAFGTIGGINGSLLYEQAAKDVVGESEIDDTTEETAMTPTENTVVATLKGDADLNGEIGIADVVIVSKHNINSTAYPLANETAEANADMNNDNVVDGLDTSALVEYNLGKK